MTFNLFFVLFPFLRYRADVLISFNNVNCVFLPTRRRITYFHQLKALDETFSEAKVRVIRSYLSHSREMIIVQSSEVKKAFESKFGPRRHHILIAWPGIARPETCLSCRREPRTLLVPVTSPQSRHKNFGFVRDVANKLGPEWQVVITADKGMEKLFGTEGSNIRFIGSMTRDALFDWYRRATKVLMPSTHETVGLPIFESLSVDTPVVAFDAPYIRALRAQFGIESGLSLVVSPEEAANVIKATEKSSVIYKSDFCVSEWQNILKRVETAK